MSDPTPHATQPRTYPVIESVILAVLISVLAVARLHAAFIKDSDIWWHLRTGQWILAHHAIPRVDHFTNFAAGKPWRPYSWLFEACAYFIFHHFGLAGILVATSALLAAISGAIYHTIRRLQPDFLLGVVITFVASLSLLRLATPRPWLFTILFSAIQLDILFHARKTGRWRELLWLPPLYILWANIHIEFIDGFFMLGAAFVEALLAIRWQPARTLLRPAPVIVISLICLPATLVNPFGWRIYQTAYVLVTQTAVKYVSEMHAMNFRLYTDYLTLLLALAAATALGYERRLRVFETLLLAFAAVVSFRSGRDMWVMILCASAILAQGIPMREAVRHRIPAFMFPVVIVVTACILFVATLVSGVNNARLDKNLAKIMPVRAVQVIQQNGYRGPLFNTYNWGGYLIWSLRIPVSIDGRTDVDGDQRIADSIHAWEGKPEWKSNSALAAAGLVIGPADSALTQLLLLDPRFQLAYKDKIAAVFTARRLREKPAMP